MNFYCNIFQAKRAPYSRQQTYTKFSEGLVNLGFDENADAEKAKNQRETKEAESTKSLAKITENNNNVIKKVEKVEKLEQEDVKLEENIQP